MFTDEQQAMINYGNGPLVVLAGAGGGKSTTLVERILTVLNRGEIPPQKIWVSTFTKDASLEIKEKAIKAIGARAQLLQAGTLHSLCFALYKSLETKFNPYYVEPSIIMEGEALSKIARFLRDNNSRAKDYNAILMQISSWKNGLMSPQMLSKTLDSSELLPSCIPHSQKGSFYHAYCFYEKMLRDEKRIDYDDMLVLTHNILASNPEALEFARRKVSYIFLDEVQDNNKVQYEIVRMLTNHFTCVGDIKQSLYSFRGADIRATHEFIRKTNAHVLYLTKNFRSTSTIVEASNKLISANTEGKVKQVPTREGGCTIEHYRTTGVMGEASAVLSLVVKAVGQGYKLSDIAILFRTNSQAFPIVQEFIYHNVSYRCLATSSLLFRQEVKAVLSYVRLIAQPEKATHADIKNVANIPNRFISNTTLNALKKTEKRYNNPLNSCANVSELGLTRNQVDAVEKLVRDIQTAQSKLNIGDAGALIEDILMRMGVYDHFDKEGENNALNDSIDNLQMMYGVTSRFKDVRKFMRLFTIDMKHSQDYGDDCVTIQTVHGAKGAEYPFVIIAGASDSKMPHKNASDMSEERRIFYVAVTRAQDKLSIVSHEYVQGNGHVVKPSKYIDELVDVKSFDDYYHNDSDFQSVPW